MNPALAALISRLRRTGFVQAMRIVEQLARQSLQPARAEVGRDARRPDEAASLHASERMTTVANDLAGGQVNAAGIVELDVNLLGLAGATPALPPQYSEYLLERRRQRDSAMADFYNMFDHRSLSFHYRIAAKNNPVIAYEGEASGTPDPVTRMMLAFGGLAADKAATRLGDEPGWIAPLAPQIGGSRRSAVALQALLARATARQVRIVEAEPRWLDIPREAQTRLGGAGVGAFSQLGGAGEAAATIGSAVLDIQHHFSVELGPLPYPEFVQWSRDGQAVARLGRLCTLCVGMAFRPRLRLLIEAGDMTPLELGTPERPALLGRTTWLGTHPDQVTLRDCEIGFGDA